jgi:hypothetical protein
VARRTQHWRLPRRQLVGARLPSSAEILPVAKAHILTDQNHFLSEKMILVSEEI